MPRVKRSVARAQEAPQGPRAGQGLLRPQEHALPLREGAGRALARLRLPRPQEQEADAPFALDRADQRGRSRERPLVQPVHERRAQGRDRARPQVARRSRRHRPRRVRARRRAGEGRARHRREGRVARPAQRLHGARRGAQVAVVTCRARDHFSRQRDADARTQAAGRAEASRRDGPVRGRGRGSRHGRAGRGLRAGAPPRRRGRRSTRRCSHASRPSHTRRG